MTPADKAILRRSLASAIWATAAVAITAWFVVVVHPGRSSTSVLRQIPAGVVPNQSTPILGRVSVSWNVQGYPSFLPLMVVVNRDSMVETPGPRTESDVKQGDDALWRCFTPADRDAILLEMKDERILDHATLKRVIDDGVLRAMMNSGARTRFGITFTAFLVIVGTTGVLVAGNMGVHFYRRRRWRQRGACIACGYPLGGASVCPECGHRSASDPHGVSR